MTVVRDLNEVERDALREVANIGAGHAATALSRMTDRKIMINVPQVRDSRPDTLGQAIGRADATVCVIQMHMMGDLTGRTAVLLSLAEARTLCDLLLRRDVGTTVQLGELEESSIKETGNILTSAYLTALSDFMSLMLVPSVPSLKTASMREVLGSVCEGLDPEQNIVLLVDTAFRVEGAPEVLRGEFLMVPDTPSVKAIFDAIHLR